MSVAGLIRDIIQSNPTLTHLDLKRLSEESDFNYNESAGQIILEALLNSSISTIEHLDLSENKSWFKKDNYTYREGSVEMLTEVISKQTSSLKILNLNNDIFSYDNIKKLIKKIAECGVCSTLNELHLT